MTRAGVALLVCLAPVSLLAQPVPPTPGSRVLGGLYFIGGGPTGHFGQVVGSAVVGGVGGHVSLTPRRGPFGLRLEATYLQYGSTTTRVPIGDTGSESGDRTIDNGIERIAVGPVVMQRHGRVRPYAYATIGTSWFVTRTRVTAECDASCDDEQQVRVIAEQTNETGSTFSWSAGGGVLVPVGRHGSIEVGVRYIANGTVIWLSEGDLVEDANGQLQPHPRRSPANVVELTLGYTFGH
jgi:opacity protein-like surface antigen